VKKEEFMHLSQDNTQNIRYESHHSSNGEGLMYHFVAVIFFFLSY